MRRGAGIIGIAVAVLMVLALAAGPGAASASAAAGRAAQGPSFTQLEDEFMCVVCHEPLAEADSPEAFQERDYIRKLIGQGRTPAQIRTAMIGAYGSAVLAQPPAHGFSLLIYVMPPLLVAVGIAIVLIVLPRWRRRTREAAQRAPTAAAALDPADARRLDDELGRLV